MSDHAAFAQDDAAYVLGALGPAERRAFEEHLQTCARCRDAVAELTGIPGLLSRLDPETARATLAAAPAPSGEEIATRAVERIDAGRRRRRRGWTIGAAAAALVAAAIAVPLLLSPADRPTLVAQFSSASAAPLDANIALTSVGWGTRLDMNCTYVASPDGYDAGAGHGAGPAPATGTTTPPPGSAAAGGYAMWVIAADGVQTEVSSWTAHAGTTAHVSAGTALAISDIAAIEVRSLDGSVTLLRTAITP